MKFEACERYKELHLRFLLNDLSDEELVEYLDHELKCPTGEHSNQRVAETIGLPPDAFKLGVREPRVMSNDELAEHVIAKLKAGNRIPPIAFATESESHSSAPGDEGRIWNRILRLRRPLVFAASIAALVVIAACTTYSHRASIWDGSGRVVMHDFDGLEWFPSWTLTENLRMFKHAAAAMHSGKETPFTRAMHLLDDGRTLDALLAIEEALDPSNPVQPEDAEILPLLARALRLQAGLADGPGNPNEDYRSFALLVAARLLREHPDTTPSAVQASANYRTYLVSMLNAPQANRPLLDRLHALTALGGCGTAEVISNLGNWAADSHRTGEERRLCVRAAESILRRSIPCAFVADIDFGAVGRQIQEIYRTATPETWPGIEEDLADLARAASVAARASRQSSEFATIISKLDINKLTDVGRAFVLSAAQLPDAVDIIRQKSTDLLRRNAWAEMLGQMCALLGDSKFAEEMRRLAESTGRVDAFEAGRRLGALELRGVRDELEVAVDAPTAPLRVSFEGRSIEPDPDDSAELATRHRELDENAIAKWLFIGTSMHDARASGIGIPSDPSAGISSDHVRTNSSDSPDESRVKLADPGQSELTLRFGLASQTALLVTVEYIKRAHQSWPYDGAPRLSIEFDGDNLVRDFEVANKTWVTQTFAVSEQRASQGEHAVVIRLSPRATAACSIRSVRIVELR